jgi:hypothetical protein
MAVASFVARLVIGDLAVSTLEQISTRGSDAVVAPTP